MLFFIYCTEWFHRWLSESWRRGWHCQSHRSDHRERRVMGSGEEKTFGTLCNSFFFWEQLDLTKVVYSADWHPQNHISFFSNLQSRWSNGFKTNSWGQIDTFLQNPRSWVAWEPSWRNQDVRPGLENFTIRQEVIPGCVCGFSPRPTPALQSNTLAWPLQARVWRWSMRNVISDCSLNQEQSSTPTCLHLPVCWEREPTLRFVSKFTKFSKTPIFPSGRLLLCVLRQHWQRRRGQHRIGWPDCWNHWGPPMNVLLANLLKKKNR